MGDLAYRIIVIISIGCALISAYLIKFANKNERVFFFYILVIAFFETLAYFFTLIVKVKNNLPGLHVFTLFQFIALTFFFNACLKELVVWFKYKWILGLGTVGIVANSLFVQSIYSFNSYSKTFVELYIIGMSITLFLMFIKDKRHDQVNMKPSVSFLSAIFLQSSVSIIFSLYSNQIMEMQTSYIYIIMDLRIIINYITLFIILFGLWQIHARAQDYSKKTIKI